MRLFLAGVFLFNSISIANANDISDCQRKEFSEKIIPACTRLIEGRTNAGDKADYYAFRGYAYDKTKQYEKAERDFSQALRGYELNILWRGIVRLQLKRPAEALADFDVFINFPVNAQVGYYYRGLALEALLKPDWALISYGSALQSHKGYPYENTDTYWWRGLDVSDLEHRIAALNATMKVEALDPQTPQGILTKYLYTGQAAIAERTLLAYTSQNPVDQQGHYALGVTQFVMAIEHLGQSLYRYGLKSLDSAWMELPFLRFPVPVNPKPETFRYEDARAILIRFVDDLAIADASLQKVTDSNVALPIQFGLVRLDLDADGKAEEEALWQIYASISGQPMDGQQAKLFAIRFDLGDAAWMRGYSHLLRAMSEFLLAHDWHDVFDHTFFRFFPDSGLPNGQLAVTRGDRGSGEIADIITLIHLVHWPVNEPERMENVLHHLESVASLSKVSWGHILAEKDDDHEWIPNPSQTGMLPSMRVTQEIVDGWLGFVDQFDGMLQGKVMLGHWRLEDGFNLRRVFLEPKTFDLILWLQGSAALPYVEKGPVASGDSMQRLEQIFGGNFFGYAVWFN